MPAKLAETLGLSDAVRSIPIIDPTVTLHSVGLVVPQRDPLTPLIAALTQIAREVAPTLEPLRRRLSGRDGNFRLSLFFFLSLRLLPRLPRQGHADHGAGPDFERSRIEPPCRLVSDLAMARPSPEPG